MKRWRTSEVCGFPYTLYFVSETEMRKLAERGPEDELPAGLTDRWAHKMYFLRNQPRAALVDTVAHEHLHAALMHSGALEVLAKYLKPGMSTDDCEEPIVAVLTPAWVGGLHAFGWRPPRLRTGGK